MPLPVVPRLLGTAGWPGLPALALCGGQGLLAPPLGFREALAVGGRLVGPFEGLAGKRHKPGAEVDRHRSQELRLDDRPLRQGKPTKRLLDDGRPLWQL